MKSGEILNFLRKRDYIYEKAIGQGVFGKTVLLKDDIINEYFVCKKYSPDSESNKETHFENFINEIKLLHLLYHKNIVRIFNYYLYPKESTGYILMEYVDGENIGDYLKKHPEEINTVFNQTIEGFKYLEENNILHRDIRQHNILITKSKVVKIIDFGFGKKIIFSNDYDMSIDVNWWCEVPDEFSDDIYNHRTEIYFIGKLFEKIIRDNSIQFFSYQDILEKMISKDIENRIESFNEILKSISLSISDELYFSSDEKIIYRNFANSVLLILNKIEHDAKYEEDIDNIIINLEQLYKSTMLEEVLYDVTKIIRCFINGSYYFRRESVSVDLIKKFLSLLKSGPKEKQNIIMSNLWTRLDSVERYSSYSDDLPF